MSESCYVIFGLWNCVTSIYLHCWHDIRWILIIILLQIWFIYFLNGLNPYASTDIACWLNPISLETKYMYHCEDIWIVERDVQDFANRTKSQVLEKHFHLLKLVCQLLFVIFLRLLQSSWLNDPSIRGKPRGDSDMVGGDSWGSGDNKREELGVEGKRSLKCWGVSSTATTGVFL